MFSALHRVLICRITQSVRNSSGAKAPGGREMSITVWQSIKKKLRIRINPILVKVWIDPLEATIENGVVNLVAPNEFVEKWVRDNLLGSIREAAGEVLSGSVGVVLSLEAPAFSDSAEKTPTRNEFLLSDSERILGSIDRLHKRLRICIGLEKPDEPSTGPSEGWGLKEEDHKDDFPLDDELDGSVSPDFDEVLDAVLDAFGISFREIMSENTYEVILAKRALYYLCARYKVSPDEVALNMDCTVSEVRSGAQEMDKEISEAIDSGEDLDQLLIRLFHKT